MINAILLKKKSNNDYEVKKLLSSDKRINVIGSFDRYDKLVGVLENIYISLIVVDSSITLAQRAVLKSYIEKKNLIVEIFDYSAIEEENGFNSKRSYSEFTQLIDKMTNIIEHSDKKNLVINLFGEVMIGYEDGRVLEFSSKKSEELFLYLLHNHTKKLTKDMIINDLWNGYDYEIALRQLYNNIYVVRKDLKDSGVSREELLIDENYHLVLGDVNFDVETINNLYNKLDTVNTDELISLCDSIVGPYMNDLEYEWLSTDKSEIHDKLIRILVKSAHISSEKEYMLKHESYLLRAYDLDPSYEEVTDYLVAYYIGSDQLKKALAHYRKYNDYINGKSSAVDGEEKNRYKQIADD
jgi:two-component SAPR family response regulator